MTTHVVYLSVIKYKYNEVGVILSRKKRRNKEISEIETS